MVHKTFTMSFNENTVATSHRDTSAQHNLLATHDVFFNVLLGLFTNTNMHRADSHETGELRSWYSTDYAYVLLAMGNTTQSYATHNLTKVCSHTTRDR